MGSRNFPPIRFRIWSLFVTKNGTVFPSKKWTSQEIFQKSPVIWISSPVIFISSPVIFRNHRWFSKNHRWLFKNHRWFSHGQKTSKLTNHRWFFQNHRWFLKIICVKKSVTGDFQKSPVIFEQSPVIKSWNHRWFCRITGDFWKITGDKFTFQRNFGITGDFSKSPVILKNHLKLSKSLIPNGKITGGFGKFLESMTNHRWFSKNHRWFLQNSNTS